MNIIIKGENDLSKTREELLKEYEQRMNELRKSTMAIKQEIRSKEISNENLINIALNLANVSYNLINCYQKKEKLHVDTIVYGSFNSAERNMKEAFDLLQPPQL